LLSSHEQNGKVVVQLKHAEQGGDRWSEAAADFLIGADGAHSRVRKELAVPFKGGAYDGDFVLGDVKISWPWDYGSIHTFVSERGVVAAFPMPGERQYRLILIPSEKKVTAAGPVNASTKSFTKSSPKSSTDISIEDFESIVTRISDGKIRVEAFTWLTRFTVHHRMVTKYQVGRQFLAGDAAHIHSPVGGQGMNTGIQDALNLACKIKSVLTGQSSIESLSDYEKERSPVARGVLRGTDFVFRMALLPNQRIVGLLRRHLLPAVVRNRWLQKRAVVAISEIKQARKEILNYQILNTDARVGTPV
jgi:3-(3-hydroxy-phenyl)propionate hydroxylase